MFTIWNFKLQKIIIEVKNTCHDYILKNMWSRAANNDKPSRGSALHSSTSTCIFTESGEYCKPVVCRTPQYVFYYVLILFTKRTIYLFRTSIGFYTRRSIYYGNYFVLYALSFYYLLPSCKSERCIAFYRRRIFPVSITRRSDFFFGFQVLL